MKDVKASVGRLEIGFARFEEKISHLATKDDISRLSGDVREVSGKVANLPTTWQVIAILSGMMVGVASLVYATDTFLSRSRGTVTSPAAPMTSN